MLGWVEKTVLVLGVDVAFWTSSKV